MINRPTTAKLPAVRKTSAARPPAARANVAQIGLALGPADDSADVEESNTLPTGESILHRQFKDLYFYLYSNSNIPRAERLAAEVTRILLCRLYDELVYGGKRLCGSPSAAALRAIFEEAQRRWPTILSSTERLHLDDRSCEHVLSILGEVRLLSAGADTLGDAFQAFLGPALRGDRGQFFTPRSVVRAVVTMLDPKPHERVLDPACGSGGFIGAVASHWLSTGTGTAATKAIESNITGIDKDADLARLTRLFFAIISGGSECVYNADSLDESHWPSGLSARCDSGFDVIVTNPPFGAKIGITDEKLLAQYDLGHDWSQAETGAWSKTKRILEKQDPQILFLERCVRLLRDGGRLGIVLPEGVVGNRGSSYILDWLRSQGEITGIIDCPRTLFQPSTDIKTVVVLFQRGSDRRSKKLFMAVARSCGHDRRGRPLVRDGRVDDEFPKVAEAYSTQRFGSHLAFLVDEGELTPGYLVPRYYDPDLKKELEATAERDNADLVRISDLVERGVLRVWKGHEPGAEAYGTGTIPFIRTSDVANWEVSYDPTKSVSDEVYRDFAERQQLRPFDVLFVNDGRYRIGQTCMLTEDSVRSVIQSHFRILRATEERGLSPFLLLYLLKRPIIARQIASKVIIQSTIATLGNRLGELVIPVPRSPEVRKAISTRVREIIEGRAALLRAARTIDMDFEHAAEEEI